MSRWVICVLLVFVITGPAFADHPATTQPAAKKPATQPADIPSIVGVWEEGPGVLVKITQDGKAWNAECRYVDSDHDEIKWEIKSASITADGKLRGKLHHTEAPKGWKLWQLREATLSSDGKTISGTAKWDGGGDKFTWTRQPDKLAPPKVGDSEDALLAYVKSRATPPTAEHCANGDLATKVRSETLSGKVIEVYAYYEGDSVLQDIYSIEGKTIVAIDHQH